MVPPQEGIDRCNHILEDSQMDSTLVHPSNHYSQLGDNLEKKIREQEARIGEIFMGDHRKSNIHDFNTQSPFLKPS